MPDNTLLILIISSFFLCVYWLTRSHLRINNWLLFLFGIFMYAWGDLWRGVLLLALLPVDFILVRFLYREKDTRKLALICGLGLNILVWIGSRYLIADERFLISGGIALGVSFYILRKIGFLISAFHDEDLTKHSFLEYGLYVSFFPQILSGPIEKPKSFLKQISHRRDISEVDLFGCIHLIILGLFKKIAIADNMRVIVDRVFAIEKPALLIVYAGTIAFSLQLFCDFSGYTDISRGIAGLIGFKTTRNFDNPFLSRTPQDFWNRWHISFTNWLQTNIYFPVRRYLLRNEYTTEWIKTAAPIMAVMIFSGYWHGSTATFLVWGVYHGVLLIIFHYFRAKRGKRLNSYFWDLLGWLMTFQLILLGWLIFRSNSIQWLSQLTVKHADRSLQQDMIVSLSILSQTLVFSTPLFFHYLINKNKRIAEIINPIIMAAGAVILILFGFSGFQPFVYVGF